MAQQNPKGPARYKAFDSTKNTGFNNIMSDYLILQKNHAGFYQIFFLREFSISGNFWPREFLVEYSPKIGIANQRKIDAKLIFPLKSVRESMLQRIRNKASLSFGRTSAGIVWFFLGALRHYLCTLCVCIHLNKSLVTDDWALSLVVILHRLVKVYNFFKRNRVSRTFKNPSVQCDFQSAFL